MKTATRAKWLLQGKGCDDCQRSSTCKKNQEELLVCGSWEKESDLSKLILPLIRKSYPSLIANELVSVQPMASSTGVIYGMNTVCTNDDGEEEITMGPMVGPSIEDMLNNQKKYLSSQNWLPPVPGKNNGN